MFSNELVFQRRNSDVFTIVHLGKKGIIFLGDQYSYHIQIVIIIYHLTGDPGLLLVECNGSERYNG